MDEDCQQPSTPVGPRASEIDPCSFLLNPEDSWDWGTFLDMHIPVEYDQQQQPKQHDDENHLQPFFPWETSPLPSSRQSPLQATTTTKEIQTKLKVPLETGSGSDKSKVRKRDPRLVCENYLSGRIPCACPEMDKKMEEAAAVEEMVGVFGATGTSNVRKKARVAAGGIARCQVLECQADINDLKGYHKRHRVCLRCANAKSVVLDGEPKRYCQQCGKFHILSDFDEGRRSCRRKLERHNKRRRRRPDTDQRTLDEKENNSTEIMHIEEEDVVQDDEQSKESLNETQTSNGSDSLCLSNKSMENMLVESRGQDSDLNIRTVHSNSISSFTVSSGPQIEKKDNSSVSPPLSSLHSEKKNAAYSTVCPTGRMSFKLYDWNPADFPRRLRRQIFQWLDCMPVELEGYIRPGCTILTIFISMPHLMWNKLSNDTVHYLHDFVKTPESLFFRRGNVHIHFNNTLFQILQDGTSLVNVKMEVQVPKLHYVYPVLFEAGKPIEIFACGSNLFQPNFRFLISFGGKYLEHELDKVEFGVKGDLSCNAGHQMLRIHIPQTDKKHFGPAFIEVENKSGLSNFKTILFAEKEIYLELLQTMQQPQCNLMNPNIISKITNGDRIQSLCEIFLSRPSSSMSEFLLDVGWFLKEPQFDDIELFFSIGNAQRLDCLIRYLVQNGSTKTLKKVMPHLETMLNYVNGNEWVHQVPSNQVHAVDVKLIQKCMDDANKFLHKIILYSPIQEQLDTKDGVLMHEENVTDDIPFSDKERKPLLGKESRKLLTGNKWQLEIYKSITNTRFVIFIMVGVVTCCGLCMAILHPHKATEFAVSVRRCVFGTHDLQ